MKEGLYEQLISKLISVRIDSLDSEKFYVKQHEIDKAEAAHLLSQYLVSIFRKALSQISGHDAINRQIEISNKVIEVLRSELNQEDFSEDIIDTQGRILKAVFSKINAPFSDLDNFLHEITPYTRLSQSHLFTGAGEITLESELRKEILSADRIDFLVSFIKWKGYIVLERELQKFTEKGGRLRVITTTYMGASDLKAIQKLSTLKNTQVKISYNTGNERLHAKSYLFFRETGFHTAYIGSSNMSRTALTDGLEWNLKVTTREIGHIIDVFEKTFEHYWESSEFELFDSETHTPKLREALRKGSSSDAYSLQVFFDLEPYPYQKEILEKLEVERLIHSRYRNLIVAATGTGKTMISAFDYKAFRKNNPTSRLLFIAHRKEILQQAMGTFQAVLRDNNFGNLWVDGIEPSEYEFVFASIQTLNNRLTQLSLTPDYYDFIIFDEVHHIQASSYRPIIQYFKPKILVGLTATPERNDGADVLEDFDNRTAAEIRLPEALNRKLLCPFQYFGISDSVDLSGLSWSRGKYVPSELSRLYTGNDRRVGEILSNLDKYLKDTKDVTALGFCVSMEHARYMAEKFVLKGYNADFLTSENAADREAIRRRFQSKAINYLFVVDIFNEGVDIPEIDTVLFLRPTESLTIFLQQFGRGLRLAKDKEVLTVLDFVGNARPEYDFENKFRALIGKTNTSVIKEIEDDFPHLPLGCSIILEKKAKEIILQNVVSATSFGRQQIVQKIRNFQHQTTLPLNLSNFLKFYNLPVQAIYSRERTWKRLCFEAGVLHDFSENLEINLGKAIKNKWISTQSTSYFKFILSLSKAKFTLDINKFSEEQNLMGVMLIYDLWPTEKDHRPKSLHEAFQIIQENPVLISEVEEFIGYQIEQISFLEINIELPYAQPLKVHARYTRDQILSAFRLNTLESRSSNREGVAENKQLNTELLFVDLVKSEEDFSPTTMYDDFAINERLFHWQSQNATRPDKGKGLTYIQHKSLGKKILKFVREKSRDEFGNTMGYVFLGEADFVSTTGAKPMSITWELKEPIPNYLWKESTKRQVG